MTLLDATPHGCVGLFLHQDPKNTRMGTVPSGKHTKNIQKTIENDPFIVDLPITPIANGDVP